MNIDEYIASLRPRTAIEYNATKRYLQLWQAEREKYPTFADFFADWNIAPETKTKHLRQAKTLCSKCNLDYEIGSIPTPAKSPPPKFSDRDFQKLINAFDDCSHPKFIISEHRCRFWQAIIHFAAVTALRREAILGLNLANVNFSEYFVEVPADDDKKNKIRYKPITEELAAELLELHRFIEWNHIPARHHGKLFPWIHGDKKWYQCWKAAEQKVGKRFWLHDLKRFSGELALRAGATPLELQQHMDHADLKTTLTHYCRPTTTTLVRKFKVPLPNRRMQLTPLFTEPEIKAEIESAIVRKLVDAGADADLIRFVLDNYGNIDVGKKPQRARQKKGSKTADYNDCNILPFPNLPEEGGVQ